MTDEFRTITRSEHLHAAQQNLAPNEEPDSPITAEAMQLRALVAISQYLAAIELDLHKIATRKACR